MMRTASAVLCLALMGTPALAADRPHCMSLEKAQKTLGKDTAVVALSPAQFHFLQGMYVALPTTPDGLPPGDGALLLTKDKADEGVILWTRGVLACEPTPIRQAAKLMRMLADVKAGATGEGDGI